jgi:hypothetical protein
MSAKTQHRKNAAKQRTWAMEALNDADYNERQAKREQKFGKPIEARMSRREARLDRKFAKKRKTWATEEARKGK